MSILNNDCYGNKKYEIVQQYYLNPIAHIKMLPHMEKMGCCGLLTEQFYIFSYTGIKNRSNRGTFFVGTDCAKQLIDMVNAIKKRAGKGSLEIPKMFDISLDGGFIGGWNKEIKRVNYDTLILLLLLASAWDVNAFYGAPANILERIVRNPLKTLGRKDLLKVNELIEKAALFDTIRKHELHGTKIGRFHIDYFNTVVDFILTEEGS